MFLGAIYEEFLNFELFHFAQILLNLLYHWYGENLERRSNILENFKKRFLYWTAGGPL